MTLYTRNGLVAAILTLIAGAPAAAQTPGTLDTTFAGAGGIAIDFGRPSHVHGMALQADGKLVVAGEAYSGGELNAYAIARLDVNGALDPTFGTLGRVEQAFGDASNAHAVAIAADGSILVGG